MSIMGRPTESKTALTCPLLVFSRSFAFLTDVQLTKRHPRREKLVGDDGKFLTITIGTFRMSQHVICEFETI